MSAAEGEDRLPAMLSGALELVELAGLRVAPSYRPVANGCSCGDAECGSPGKHPIGKSWQERASADPVAVRALWSRDPEANVGVATGVASGVVVLDVDGEAGELSLKALEALHGTLPRAPMVITSRGCHIYFAAGDVPLHNRAGKRGRGLGDGLDLRAEGGYVVAPPSLHASGTRYVWARGYSLGELPLPPLPAWIVTAASAPAPHVPPPSLPNTERVVPRSRAEKWADAGLERECIELRDAPEGTRNATLNRAAFNVGMLVAGGSLDGASAKRALLDAAMAAGLTEFEAIKTIRSGMEAGMKKDQRAAPARDLPMQPRAAAASGGSEPDAPDEPTVAPLPSLMQPRFNTVQLFSTLPPQRWMVAGLQLGPGRPTMIAGYGASAKTLAAQSLAVALASGEPVWGHYESSPAVVLHVDYEQTFFATAKRYQRLALGHGIDPRALGERLHYVEMPRVHLDKKGAEEEYLRACEGVDLVIIDALRGAAPHTDENDSSFRASIDVLTYVSQQTGCSMIVLHHASKPKDSHQADTRTLARGSSAIYDASGCVLNFVAKPGSPTRLVQQVKTPAEAEGSPIDPFELLVEDVERDGLPNAGVRVLWRLPTPVDESAKADQQFEHDAALVLKAVRKVPGGYTNVITARCGLKKARAVEVLHALADEGRLVRTVDKRKHFYHLPSGGEE